MAKAATAQRARAPQGAKRVAQAFFNELETIPEDKQAEVGKAALAMVRGTMMTRRDKAKAAKAKLRASKAEPAKAKMAAKPARKTRGPARPAKQPRTRRPTPPEPPTGETAETTRAGGES